MKFKLLTLKDLYKDKDFDLHCCEYECKFRIEQAVQEWIKAIDEDIKVIYDDPILYQEQSFKLSYLEGQKHSLKHFFNLEEKE